MKHLLALSAAAILAGCAGAYTDSSKPASVKFGEAVTANLQNQAAPPIAPSEDPLTDGARAALAVSLYQQNKSPKPESLRASDVGAAPMGPAMPGMTK